MSEIIIYKFLKKYAFSFPYEKIKQKNMYYISFYLGFIWGNWVMIYLIFEMISIIIIFIYKIIIGGVIAIRMLL